MMATFSTAQNVEPETPRPADEVRAGLLGAKILIVEDEHLVALDIQRCLAQLGHSPSVAYSGEEAVDRVADGQFDLVLMDIKLKGEMDGIEAAHTIRRSFDVPIIYLTAYADNHTLERARATEPYGYLLKPFQERELKASIEMALQRHETDKERWEQQQLQRFLAEASARMAATLDYRAVARGAAELLVPRHADWCLIHLDEVGDEVPSFTFTRPDGETDHGTVVHDAKLIENVRTTSRPEVLTQIFDSESLREALGLQFHSTLRELGARSVVCVPLVARDQTLGALAVVSGRSRPRYAVHDLGFFEDFAQRLAICLDNALLYRKAERAIRMRDDVLAIVSHDLRTPLGTILMAAESVSRQPELRRHGDMIVHAAQRMNRLIGDLLDASAINAGRLTLDRGVHAVKDILGEAIEMFRSQAEARAIRLVEELSEASLQVSCDRDRIIQVLSNLIGNALKFTSRGGTVTVGASRAGMHVCFDVRDTGRGIAPDQLPHLFERFWRANAQRSGAGLGLFIARGIIAAHDSKLDVETAPGKGSRFFFALPEAST